MKLLNFLKKKPAVVVVPEPATPPVETTEEWQRRMANKICDNSMVYVNVMRDQASK